MRQLWPGQGTEDRSRPGRTCYTARIARTHHSGGRPRLGLCACGRTSAPIPPRSSGASPTALGRPYAPASRLDERCRCRSLHPQRIRRVIQTSTSHLAFLRLCPRARPNASRQDCNQVRSNSRGEDPVIQRLDRIRSRAGRDQLIGALFGFVATLPVSGFGSIKEGCQEVSGID